MLYCHYGTTSPCGFPQQEKIRSGLNRVAITSRSFYSHTVVSVLVVMIWIGQGFVQVKPCACIVCAPLVRLVFRIWSDELRKRSVERG